MATIKKARWQARLNKHFNLHSSSFIAVMLALSPAFGAAATLLCLLAARWIGGAQ
jgi:hypothetical protein